MTPALPATAWEQAVFVALFIVMILAVLAWTSNESKRNREFQEREACAREEAQEKRDAEWRRFLAQQNDANQQALAQQRAMDQRTSGAVQKSLDGLTLIIGRMVEEIQEHRSEFQTHDRAEWARLDEMAKRIGRRADQPRSNE